MKEKILKRKSTRVDPRRVSLLSPQWPRVRPEDLTHKGSPLVFPDDLWWNVIEPLSSLSPGKTFGVYGLFEKGKPGRIRYVGSSEHIENRYVSHLSSIAARWLGLEIGCTVLERLQPGIGVRELVSRERAWIKVMRLRGEADLNRAMV